LGFGFWVLLFAFCFLLFAFCFLLFAFCFLLFAFCFLLFAFCFLLFGFWVLGFGFWVLDGAVRPWAARAIKGVGAHSSDVDAMLLDIAFRQSFGLNANRLVLAELHSRRSMAATPANTSRASLRLGLNSLTAIIPTHHLFPPGPDGLCNALFFITQPPCSSGHRTPAAPGCRTRRPCTGR
jgi:hypothetical protein